MTVGVGGLKQGNRDRDKEMDGDWLGWGRGVKVTPSPQTIMLLKLFLSGVSGNTSKRVLIYLSIKAVSQKVMVKVDMKNLEVYLNR